MPKQIFNPLTGKFDQVLAEAKELSYVPTTPADWTVVPDDVGEALDSLAASSGGGGGGSFAIGDTKLTYGALGADWLLLNGQLIYKPDLPTMYDLLPNELGTATQTLSPPVGGNNGWYGNQGNLFVANGKMVSYRRWGGTSPNSTTNQVYVSDWNATTRVISNTTAVSVTGVSGTTLNNIRTSPTNYRFPYLLYSVDLANGNVVSKWDTSGAYVSAVTLPGTGGTWFTSRLSVLGGLYYVFGNTSSSSSIRMWVKDAVLDTWSTVGTYSIAFPSGYYPAMAPAVFTCPTDGIIYMAMVVTNGTNYQLCLFKNSGSFVFTLHQTLGGASANYFQYAADVFNDSDTEFMAKIGTSIYKYTFNSGTGNFDQGTAATLASLGFTDGTQFFMRTASQMNGTAAHITFDSTMILISNATQCRTYALDKAAFTFTAVTPLTTSTSAFNSNGHTMNPDGYTHIHGEQGTNSAGTLVVKPIRKALGTLADPQTNLKYQVKVQ